MSDTSFQVPPMFVRPSRVTASCWEVADSSLDHGARLQLWDTRGRQAEWILEYTSLGQVQIRNRNSSLYAGILDDPGNGAKIVQVNPSRVEGWQCIFELHRSPEYPALHCFGLAAYPLYRIECENGSLGNGTSLQLWETTEARTLWHLELAQ